MVERVRRNAEPQAPQSDIEFISSGCTLLNLALGGGWAEGRVSNIVGDKSSGKTLLCIEAAANFVQKYPRGRVRYREAESAFDESYAAALGFPVDSVDFGEPVDTIEDVFEDLTKVLNKARAPELYIIDSLDALSDRAEMSRKMDEGSYGVGKAKQLSQLFRRIVRKLEEKRITVMVVSQVRDNIGVTFGRKTTRSGGRALDFYASQVLFLAQLGKIKKTIQGVERPIGIQIKALMDKNKVGLPFREARFDLLFSYGVDDAGACVDFLQSINALGDIDLTKEAARKFLTRLNKMEDAEYHRTMKRLQRAVTKRWYQIEQGFLPSRKKY